MSINRRFDHSGSTFDSFLEEEGILAETEAVALKRVIAWQIERAMVEKKITKNALAKQLSTSRTQVDRLLDPAHVGVSIETVARAAKAVGKRVRFEIVDEVPASPKATRTPKKNKAVVRGESIKRSRASQKRIA